MSELPADSPPLPPAGESWLAEPRPPVEGWGRRKFILILLFVLAFHLALVFLLGTKKQIVPRPMGDVPHWQLANAADELIALSDPTLFARPNAHDVVTAYWRQMPPVPQPSFDYTESPHYLQPASEHFGTSFHELVESSQPAVFPLNFKPAPEVVVPNVTLDNPVPQATTMEISDELARRQLLHADTLPAIGYNDVLKPTRVQALVDAEGNVASAVVLGSSGFDDADQKALKLVRNLSFVPASQLMFGEITFTWHTVPTNAVPAKIP